MAPLHRTIFLVAATLTLLFHSGIAQGEEDDIPEDEDMGDDYDGDYGDGDGGEMPLINDLQELKTVEDFEKFIDNEDASVIGAFASEKMADPTSVRPHDWDDDEDGEWEAPTIDTPGLMSLKSISSSEYGYRFAYTTTPAVMEKLKLKAGSVYLYRAPRYVSKEFGDRPRERFPGDNLTQSAASHWLSIKAQPLVGEYSSTTQDRYTSAVLIIYLNLDWNENTKKINYVLKRARKVADGLRGKLALAVASISSKGYELDDYGLSSQDDSDVLMGIRAGSDYSADKYAPPSDKAFSADTLKAFADAYLAGELTPFKKPDDESIDADIADGKDEL